VSSAKSMKFARESLAKCISSHDICRQNYRAQAQSNQTIHDNRTIPPEDKKEILTASDLPSRLLEIYPLRCGLKKTGLGVQLINVGEAGRSLQKTICKSGFVSLSYCWGGEQSFQLNRTTQAGLEKGVAATTLPKTLQDAIEVANNLALRYIWIDVLCILQDKPLDIATEIARMPIYYGANTVTLCAASADRVSQGFLAERSENSYDFGPFQIQYTTPKGHSFFQLFRERSMDVEPIAGRAWTLQESLLSRRLLIFSSRQLFWHCMHIGRGCAGWHGEVPLHARLRPLIDVRQIVPRVHPISALNNLSSSRLWDALVEDYTTRTLGVESDKLLAISALSAYVSPFFKARFPDTEYIAGHWVSLENQRPFLRQLFWSTDMSKSRRPQNYRCPSWSWAAIDGPINFFEILTENMVYPAPVAKVLSTNIQLMYATAPFGQVIGGYVRLRASVRAVVPPSVGIPLLTVNNARDQQNKKENSTFLILCPDTNEDNALVDSWKKGIASIHFLQIWPCHQYLNSPMGLLLAPLGDSSDSYRRIGLFYFDCSVIKNVVAKGVPMFKDPDYKEPDGQRDLRESFFTDTDLKDVKVV
jgi:hypothetical protein